MTRRCSHCCANGHNSRTCPGRSSPGAGGVRLFGVRLTEAGTMKKSASMGCLSHYSSPSSSLSSAASAHASPSGGNNKDGCNGSNPSGERDLGRATGYASDDPSRASCSFGCRSERKKGTPWTEEEHRRFLIGLQKLGKGDWRGIARNFVVSRTPTQVASHAQKYFIRQNSSSRKKRRSSLFDMAAHMAVDQDQIPIVEEQQMLRSPLEQESPTAHKLLPLLNSTLHEDSVTTEVIMAAPIAHAEDVLASNNLPPIAPALYPSFISLPVHSWPPNVISMPVEEVVMSKATKVLKPTPVLPENTVHVDELLGRSNLTLAEKASLVERIEPSVLSTKLLRASASGHSAFHLNPVLANAILNHSSGNTMIHAA